MKRVSLIGIMVMCFSLINLTMSKADTITFSSDNLNFSQPINLLSDPATTIQLGYNFPIYRSWLCMDIRGRTAQQNAGNSTIVDNGTVITTNKINLLPSFDAGVRIKFSKDYPFDPYVFSLLDYTTYNLTSEYTNVAISKNISVLGFRVGAGTNILLSHDLPAWLFNIDTGYQYLPANVASFDPDGVFLSMGFGLSF